MSKQNILCHEQTTKGNQTKSKMNKSNEKRVRIIPLFSSSESAISARRTATDNIGDSTARFLIRSDLQQRLPLILSAECKSSFEDFPREASC